MGWVRPRVKCVIEKYLVPIGKSDIPKISKELSHIPVEYIEEIHSRSRYRLEKISVYLDGYGPAAKPTFGFTLPNQYYPGLKKISTNQPEPNPELLRLLRQKLPPHVKYLLPNPHF